MTPREQLLDLLKTLPISEVRSALREVEALTGVPFDPPPGWDDCARPEERFEVVLTSKGPQGLQVLRLVREHLDRHFGYTPPPPPTPLLKVAQIVKDATPENPLVLKCEHETVARDLLTKFMAIKADASLRSYVIPVGSSEPG